MKKILLISAFPPSPYSAGQNFTLNLLSDLAKVHHVDFIYFSFRDQSFIPTSPAINVIKKIPLSPLRRVLNVLLFPFFHPLFSVRFSFSTLSLIKNLTRKNQYDALCFDFSQVFLYSFFFKEQKKILISHDVIAQKSSRETFAIARWWASWTERLLFRQKNIQVFTFSDKDRLLIQHNAKEAPVTVINFYLSSKIFELPARFSDDEYFCFFAAWNRPENHEGLSWFIKEVFPKASAKKFLVIGANMPASLEDQVRSTPNMEYLGFIENPYGIIANARALIAPLFRGAGVKVKAIESLACGTPVIGTGVALEGVPDVTEGSLFNCATANDFIQTILNFRIANENKARIKETFLRHYNDESKRIHL